MKERIENIMHSKDPCGQDIENLDKRMGNAIRTSIIATTIFAFIVALIIALLFSEAHDNSRYSIVTFFGLNFEIDNDNIFISPFMVFCYIFVILEVVFSLISLIISALIISIQANVAKKNVLNNTYRTAQLLELIASSLTGENQQPASHPAEPRANTQRSLNQNTQTPAPAPDIEPTPAADTSNQVICPRCRASQFRGRTICYKCGYELQNQQVPKANPIPTGNTSDRIFCPGCGLEQPRSRRACLRCGREFQFQ